MHIAQWIQYELSEIVNIFTQTFLFDWSVYSMSMYYAWCLLYENELSEKRFGKGERMSLIMIE